MVGVKALPLQTELLQVTQQFLEYLRFIKKPVGDLT
jgi:hypothetical protein